MTETNFPFPSEGGKDTIHGIAIYVTNLVIKYLKWR